MNSLDVSKFVCLGKKIVGAGLNYRSLIKARGLTTPDKPIVFLKPTTSYITEGQLIKLPKGYEVHHEVELGVIIGKTCRNISPEDAKECIAGYCIALDLTAVNEIGEARKSGHPWSLGKGFDTACPVGPALALCDVPDPCDVRLWLKVNGETKQDCSTADMLFSMEEFVSFVSKYMTLEPYDLILTGSPDGPGPIKSGDTIECGLGDSHSMTFCVA